MLSRKTCLIISLSLLLCLVIFMGVSLFIESRREGITVYVDRKASAEDIYSGYTGGKPVLLPGDTVNINTDDASTLELLDGIGEVLAQRIVDYREEYGPFTEAEEIINVPGISGTLYEKIADYIRTED